MGCVNLPITHTLRTVGGLTKNKNMNTETKNDEKADVKQSASIEVITNNFVMCWADYQY